MHSYFTARRDIRRPEAQGAFIQDVNPIGKRVLEWDGSPSDMPTKDKLYISVDLFARWIITDPLQHFLRSCDERSARSRLDEILGRETRNAVAEHELIDVIRTTRDCVPLRDTLPINAERELDMGILVPNQKGRKLVEQEIFTAAAETVRMSCKSVIADNAPLALSTDSGLFKLVKGMTPEGEVVPSRDPGGN